MRSYGSSGHRVVVCIERDDRSRRGPGRLAEEDEDDDGDEGDEESLEVEEDVLEENQWTGEPRVGLRRFAECGGERHQGGIHRPQQAENREIGGETGRYGEY